MKPSVGRIVHYHGPIDTYRSDIPYAALIVGEVDGDRANLFVYPRWSDDLGPAGIKDRIPFNAEGNEANTWTWPPRV